MTRDKGSALDGFWALYDGTGNAESTVGMSVQTKIVLDYDLVQLCQDHGDKPHKATPLGRFPELWPFDMLKRPLVEHAEEFVRQIKTKGYEATTPVTEFKVWGPYMEKVGDLKTFVPEEDNHVIPNWAKRTAHQAWLYQGDEFDWEKGCAFIIVGFFTRPANLGVLSEETGKVIV